MKPTLELEITTFFTKFGYIFLHEMPPCHHSWFPPIVSGSEKQFRKKKKKKKTKK